MANFGEAFAAFVEAMPEIQEAMAKADARLKAASQPPHKPMMYRYTEIVEAEQVDMSPEQISRLKMRSVSVEGVRKYVEMPTVLQGWLPCYWGQWIVSRADGSCEMVNNGIFRKAYEEVPDDGNDS